MQSEMQRTGVFATEEQKKAIDEAIDATRGAGLTAPRFGPRRAAAAEREMRKAIHAAALERGLPETKGFYGYDNGTGEFIAWGSR